MNAYLYVPSNSSPKSHRQSKPATSNSALRVTPATETVPAWRPSSTVVVTRIVSHLPYTSLHLHSSTGFAFATIQKQQSIRRKMTFINYVLLSFFYSAAKHSINAIKVADLG